jgi:hypothetical protein
VIASFEADHAGDHVVDGVGGAGKLGFKTIEVGRAAAGDVAQELPLPVAASTMAGSLLILVKLA